MMFCGDFIPIKIDKDVKSNSNSQPSQSKKLKKEKIQNSNQRQTKIQKGPKKKKSPKNNVSKNQKADFAAPMSFVAGEVIQPDKGKVIKTKLEVMKNVLSIGPSCTNINQVMNCDNINDQKQPLKPSSSKALPDSGTDFKQIKDQNRMQSVNLENVESWEKHTKGIGAKISQQMGYQPGNSLGKDLQGISTPFEASLKKGRGAIGYDQERIDLKPKQEVGSGVQELKAQVTTEAVKNTKNSQDQNQMQSVNTENLGSWEKHTKGIGAKILQQMGYQPGKGLGKDLQGILTPIEASLKKGRGAIGYDQEKIDPKPKQEVGSGVQELKAQVNTEEDNKINNSECWSVDVGLDPPKNFGPVGLEMTTFGSDSDANKLNMQCPFTANNSESWFVDAAGDVELELSECSNNIGSVAFTNKGPPPNVLGLVSIKTKKKKKAIKKTIKKKKIKKIMTEGDNKCSTWQPSHKGRYFLKVPLVKDSWIGINAECPVSENH